MAGWIVFGVALTFVVGVVLSVVAWQRRQGATNQVPPWVAKQGDTASRKARQEAATAQGTELVERRVELDSRRGTLGGNEALDRALEDLERRLQVGEITADDFEREKVRLLGG